MTSLYPPEPLTAIEALRDTEAFLVAKKWADSGAWGLLLLGAVGRGKSVAAAWLWCWMRERAFKAAQGPGRFDRPRAVLWLRARALQRMTWQERASTLGRCAGAYGLVVDEMGGEDMKTGEALVDVLEERGDSNALTVMTTNLDGTQFPARYGDRLPSRLRSGGVDKGKARWAKTVGGPDLRGLK
jgi:hypothetical protein